MSAGCARKSNPIRKIRAILRRCGEAVTSSRWSPKRHETQSMKLKLWPRTLVVQLIAVTAAAVVISNLAVAFWFEHSNEQQNEAATSERVLDRASAVATTLSAIPSDSRDVVMRSMSLRRFWRFREVPARSDMAPMDEEETRLAQRLATMLPPEFQRGPVDIQLHQAPKDIPANLLPEGADKDANAIRVSIPLDKKNPLSVVFLRNPPPWPVEIMVAATVAILLASLAAALM